MFEQRQNTGKSASLAEKYANAVGQLSEANDRAAHAEHDLQVERITRQDLIDEEVARRVAEAEERIRLKVEAEFAEQKKALESQKQELEAREKEITKKADTIVQNIEVSVNKRLAELRSRAEDTALTRLADMFETFLQAFIAVVDKDSSKGQELLAKYRQKAEETQTLLKEEIKEKLDKAEAKSKAKTDHVVSLVRMLFAQKSERIVFTPEQREGLYERAMQSLNLTEESKKEFESCRDYCRDYRQKQAALKLLKNEGKKSGHGRNKLPDSLPRLEKRVIWPDCYKGHEDEYEVIGRDIQEFVLPSASPYVVQPVVRPIVRI